MEDIYGYLIILYLSCVFVYHIVFECICMKLTFFSSCGLEPQN